MPEYVIRNGLFDEAVEEMRQILPHDRFVALTNVPYDRNEDTEELILIDLKVEINKYREEQEAAIREREAADARERQLLERQRQFQAEVIILPELEDGAAPIPYPGKRDCPRLRFSLPGKYPIPSRPGRRAEILP
ncbi:MAG: hypothetical protein LBD98_03435 [Endomicrobium sp.]|jgi:hypothetical protein|nr:hypothetical protein [Endomicrobium sp.]